MTFLSNFVDDLLNVEWHLQMFVGYRANYFQLSPHNIKIMMRDQDRRLFVYSREILHLLPDIQGFTLPLSLQALAGFVQAVSIDINSLCFGGFHSSLLPLQQSPLLTVSAPPLSSHPLEGTKSLFVDSVAPLPSMLTAQATPCPSKH